MLTVAARTFVGSVKTVNQDAYCVLVGQAGPQEVGLLAVCDGVGGLSSGELASSVAVRELSRWFEDGVARGLTDGRSADGLALPDVQRMWAGYFEGLNGRMWAYSQSLNVRMGTTLTGAVLAGGGFVVGHVGDCRAYRLGPEGAELLTRDQTLVQRELDAGRISAEQARRHPRPSVILQALGAQETIAPAFSFGEALPGEHASDPQRWASPKARRGRFRASGRGRGYRGGAARRPRHAHSARHRPRREGQHHCGLRAHRLPARGRGRRAPPWRRTLAGASDDGTGRRRCSAGSIEILSLVGKGWHVARVACPRPGEAE